MTLRWGILSTARIGVRRVIPAILRTPRCAVVAVTSRDPARAREVADRFAIPRVHAGYQALLDDPEVDAVYNPLPNSLHAPWTVRALAAGKHVLCEKPLALDAREAQAMADAARTAGRVLLEAFMYRFHPQVERMVALVREGAVGRPWLVRAAFTFTVRSPDDIRLRADLGGGGLMDVGCYGVNVSRLVLGEPVWARAAAQVEGGVDVRLAALLGFPGGAAAQVDCGLRAPYRQGVEVVGEEGTITLARPFQPEEEPTVVHLRRGDEEMPIEIPGTNQYVRMVEHFTACALDGLPSRFPPEDAVQNMRAIDLIRAAAGLGAPRPGQAS